MSDATDAQDVTPPAPREGPGEGAAEIPPLSATPPAPREDLSATPPAPREDLSATPPAPREDLSATPPAPREGPGEGAVSVSPRVLALLTPLPDGAGPDVRYDRDHEHLRNEAAKLESLTGGSVDWNLIADAGNKLLAARSKDLLIATYVANAWFVQSGLSGLIDALDLVTALCETFWDGMHPQRPRGRAAAIGWLITRLDLGLPDVKVVAADRDTVAKAREATRRFTAMVRERFEDTAASPRPIADHLERMWLSLPAPVVAVPAGPAPSTPTAPVVQLAAPTASVQLAAPTTTLADVAQARDFLTKTGAALTQAASAIFGAAPADPLSYRLRRIGLYLPILEAPPPTNGLRTGLPPLPAPLRTQLETLAKNQKWDALLAEAEPAVSAHRFALDLHRYVAIALEGLGHADARDALVHETRALVARLPRLFELEHSDGTKLAGDAARALFAAPSTATSSAAEDDPAIDEARSLAAAGKLHEALDLLGKAQPSAGRERFRTRIAMAKACIACGAHLAADGMLAALENDAESHGLDQWEPALAAEVYAAHYECLKALGKEGRDVEARRAAAYVRLCAVAPALAAKLG